MKPIGPTVVPVHLGDAALEGCLLIQQSALEPDPHTYAIIGAAMYVHRELGWSFREVTYQRALAAEFDARGIPYQREVPVAVWFRGKPIGTFRVDFECRSVLLELKAQPFIGEAAVLQLAQYLATTGHSLGLVLNFGASSLQFKRVLPRRSSTAGPPRGESDSSGA
jgi:GxxExxY protein